MVPPLAHQATCRDRAPGSAAEPNPVPARRGHAVCPVCAGPLIEIRAKLQCARCHTICETCCEGGRWA